MTEDVDGDAIAAALEELSSLKKKLDALDDQVSQNVAAVEKSLGDLKLGIPLVLELVPLYDEDEDVREERMLAFRKYDGQWRLLYENSPDEACGRWFTTPFHSCSRDVRVELSRHLPALVHGAVKQMSERIAERERLITNVSKLQAVLANATEKK